MSNENAGTPTPSPANAGNPSNPAQPTSGIPEGSGETTSGQPTPAPAPTVTDSYTGIPEQYANDDMFSGYDSLDSVFGDLKNFKVQQASQEQSGIVRLPGPEASPEEVANFYSKLGKPEDPTGYELARPEDLPAGMDFSDEKTAEFAQFAFDNNLTAEQAKAGFELWNNTQAEVFNNSKQFLEEQLNTNLDTLVEKWGDNNSDTFKTNHQNAMRAFNTVADQEMVQQFKDNKLLASNPLVLDLLSRLGAKMNPDSVPTVGSEVSVGHFTSTDTPNGVEKAIAKFHSEGKFKTMVTKNGTEEAKLLKQEWLALNKKRQEFAQ